MTNVLTVVVVLCHVSDLSTVLTHVLILNVAHAQEDSSNVTHVTSQETLF
jgi:hypothetical protein